MKSNGYHSMIIFLDIDGVLATLNSCKTQDDRLDKRCIQVLNNLTDRLCASIVVSSTWRYNPKCISILKKGGVKADIIGITPRIDEGKRGDEILQWINTSQYKGRFVVIDDDSFDIVNVIPPECFIHIKDGFPNNGMTQSHVDEYYERVKENLL